MLNIFPSVDTGVCAQSVRTFNERASSLENAVVLCISADLPFAQARFCGAEGLDNVVSLSTFRSNFAHEYGVAVESSPLRGLTARAVVVLDENDKVLHAELVGEIAPRNRITMPPSRFCKSVPNQKASESVFRIFRRPFIHSLNNNIP